MANADIETFRSVTGICPEFRNCSTGQDNHPMLEHDRCNSLLTEEWDELSDTYPTIEHTQRDSLLHSPAASNSVGPSEQAPIQLPFPFQATPKRIDQLTPAIGYVVFTQSCLIQRQPLQAVSQ